MGRIGTFRAFLVAGIIADLVVITVIATAKTAHVQVEAWEEFSSQSGGFSMPVPKDWRLVESERRGIETSVRIIGPKGIRFFANTGLVGSLLTDLAKASPTITQSPVKFTHEGTVRAIKSFSGGRMGSASQSSTAEDGQPAKGNQYQDSGIKVRTDLGMEAYSTTFELVTHGSLQGRTLKGEVVTTWNGDGPISFWFMCPEEQYESAGGIFNSLVSGFQPKAPPSMPNTIPLPSEIMEIVLP